MTDWIEHDGGHQPVGDDVWVDVVLKSGRSMEGVRASSLWPLPEAWTVHVARYRILNQHLIDAKQAEIDRLREKLAVERDAARLEGIRLGLEAAERAALTAEETLENEWRADRKADSHLEGRSDGMGEAADLIRNLDPTTIAKEPTND